MPAPYSAKCLCGGVSLTIASEPEVVVSCFCEHCSKGAGGTSQVIGKFVLGDVKVSAADGVIGTYNFTNTSSGLPKEKTFCRTCGVPLWTVPGSSKGTHLHIRIPLIDDGLETLVPTAEIFVKNRPSWGKALEGTSQWEEASK